MPEESKIRKRTKVKSARNDEAAGVDEAAEASIAPFSFSSFFQRCRQQRLMEKYERRQLELEELYRHDDEVIAGKHTTEEPEHDVDQMLNKMLFLLNICLIVANLTAAILSGSISIASTFVDTAMDLTTSSIMGACLHAMQSDVAGGGDFQYPRGRARLELLGVIICSTLMGVANIGMVFRAIEAVLKHTVDTEMTSVTLAILLVGCSAKLFLMTACLRRGTHSTKVLAIDMRNDIMSSAVAITSAYVGSRYWRYADPLGAICVCSLISVLWFRHALEHVPLIVGVRADPVKVSRILRIAMLHDERITKIDHLCIFHFGATAIVEVHVVMNEQLPLKVTHDISHPLEKKLMQLDFVERAYVHCDYFCDGD